MRQRARPEKPARPFYPLQAMLLTSGLSLVELAVFMALIQPKGPPPELDVAEDQDTTVAHD